VPIGPASPESCDEGVCPRRRRAARVSEHASRQLGPTLPERSMAIALKPLNRALLYLLCAIVATIPLASSSVRGIVDPYLVGVVSSSVLFQSADHVPIEATQFGYVPGLGILLIILAKIGGLDPEFSMYLPIAGSLLILASFVLARLFTRSASLALAVALVIGYRWLPPTLSTVWPHTFGFALYFLFVAVYFRLETVRDPRYILQLWILYLGIHMFSYTTEVWVIAFVGATTILRYLREGLKSKLTSSLLAAVIVTFFGFTQIVYTGYIPGVEAAANEFGIGLQALLSSLFRASPPVPYGWVPPPTPPVVLSLQIVWYLALFVPPLLAFAGRSMRDRGSRNRRTLFGVSTGVVGFVAVWPVDAAAYALVGALSVGLFRYSTLSGALLTTPAVEELKSKSIAQAARAIRLPASHMMAIGLIVVSMILFASASSQGLNVSSVSKYSETQPGANWLLSNQPGLRSVYSDHLTQGQIAITAARMGREFTTTNLYSVTSYEALLGVGSYTSSAPYFRGRYVVVNLELAQFKTTSGQFTDFEPIRPHLAQIDSNPGLSLIYDDGSLWIMQGSD